MTYLKASVKHFLEVLINEISVLQFGRGLTKQGSCIIIADIKRRKGVIVSNSVTITAVVQEKNPSFLDDEVQLKKLAKELSKASKEAIEVLLALLSSTDEKVRMTAAMKLIEFDIDVKKAISQDQMQRLIAEIKLNRQAGIKQLTAEEEEEQKKVKPIVDFTTIRAVP